MKEDVLALLTNLYQKNDQAGWGSLQKEAWEKFLQIGLPDKHMEAFQYLPWHRFYGSLLKERLSSCVALETPSSEETTFLWQNDHFCSERVNSHLLPGQVVILPIREALQSSYATFLRHRIQMLTQQEQDPLALLNTALCSEGLFVYIPPKISIALPLHLMMRVCDGSVDYAGPKVHFFVGAGAQLEIVHSLDGHGGLYNGYLDIVAEEGAQVSLTSHTEKDCDLHGFFSVRASLKKKSLLRSCLATFGSQILRHDYHVALLGQEANVQLSGLCLVSESKHCHVHVYVDHSAPNAYSYQKFKNVLLDQSKASFTGKIHVKRPAQKTQAYQLTQSLLLSSQAMVYAKPSLEIFADDVKASHGATIAQLDDEQAFYLQTRGVDKTKAKCLLTKGFCQEIIDGVFPAGLKRKLTGQLEQCLQAYKE